MLDKKNEPGFTLIELLIVIAIIGILAAIAIPAFLGQREKAKARAVVAGAKGAVAEIQALLDGYVGGDAFLSIDSSGNTVCHEISTPLYEKRCSSMYPGITPIVTYDQTDINNLITIILDHHKGKRELSPYYSGTRDLFTTTTQQGVVVLTAIGSREISIRAYTSDPTNPVFSTFVISH